MEVNDKGMIQVANCGKALNAAVAALYFNDSSDYASALWTVVRELSPSLAVELGRNARAAYLRSEELAEQVPLVQSSEPLALTDAQPGVYAIYYRDRAVEDGAEYAVAELDADGFWTDCQSGAELLPLNGDEFLKLWPLDAEQPVRLTEEVQHKADLYDEVWEKARALGYMNVTMALESCRPAAGRSPVMDGLPPVEASPEPASEPREFWSTEGDRYDYRSLDALLRDTDRQAGDTVYRGHMRALDPAEWVEVDDVVENLATRAFDEAGEYAEGYPHVDAEGLDELKHLLGCWARKHAVPDFFLVDVAEKHTITEADVVRARGLAQ